MRNISKKHLKMMYKANKVKGHCPMICGANVNTRVFMFSQESALYIMDWFTHKMMTVHKKLSRKCKENGKAYLYGDFGGYVVK